MKIVHYLSEIVLTHGGVVRAVLDLCAGIAKQGHEVRLLCFDDQDAPKDWRRGGPLIPKITKLDHPERPKPIRRFKKADLLIAEGIIRGARAVHLHVPWESTNLQIARLCERNRTPYAVSIHGMLDEWTMAQGRTWAKRLYLRLGGRGLLERASAVLCTAEAERDQAVRWFSNARTEVLPLLFDLSPFEARSETSARSDGDEPIVLFLSRLHPKKGVEWLIDAAAALWREGARFRLVIAGTTDHHSVGYDAALRAYADRAGVGERAEFVGMVTGHAKIDLLRAARVLVLPTSQENWGFAPLEAMASGTPAITTRGVDIWPELERSGGAIIIDDAPDALLGAIRTLLNDPARARAMGSTGREWVMRELKPSSVIERYERLYQSLQ